MSSQTLLRKAGIASFRVKLLGAMMLSISALAAGVLYFAQQGAEEQAQQNLQREFQSELGFLLGAQRARHVAIAERCRRMARSVRIRASLEEDDVGDLYRNAEIELRDVLETAGEPVDADTRTLRANFYRFLDVNGALLSPPVSDDFSKPPLWESQLASAGKPPAEQQVGYVEVRAKDGHEALSEVIETPIITTDTGDVIGAIVLGFKPVELVGKHSGEMKTGIWLGGRLHMSSTSARSSPAFDRDLTQIVSAHGSSASNLTVQVAGAPHLLFYTLLNPGSYFPPAYQVCLYPLTDALARKKELLWEIIGAGVLVFLGGLAASHFVSKRLSAPVEKLAEDSAEHLVQRERAEAALELTEQKYRSIFENAVEGIFLFGPDGRFLSANPALARICGFESPEQLVAERTDPARELFVEPRQFTEFLAVTEKEGSKSSFEAEVYRKDGSKIWISQNARAVRNSEGALIYFEGTIEEITERKRAADELLALNAELQTALADLNATQKQIIQQERLRALGQMASGIAHDFNNALVPILGFCELLLLSPGILDDKQKTSRYLQTIQIAAKDAASVVSRLREFYRPDKNDREFVPVNLKRLVEQAITLTKPKWKDQAQASGAMVRVSLELEAVPPVAGEESALREVLTNLIFNAVDAMPEGGSLTLRTRHDGETATIEVADSGIGMSEEVRQRCLEPFFSTKGERGTGLGLSMVFGIVQRHSGSLDLRSEPGKGTTFIITLPLQDAAEHRPTAEAPARAPQRSLRVLVVDDEAPVRDTLAAVLATDGHEVELAIDGLDGLKRFGAREFDLVMTDRAMPGMSGDQMAATIKLIAPRMPIILLTGFGLFHDKSEFPDVDVLASKPIRIPALREAIATAMQTV